MKSAKIFWLIILTTICYASNDSYAIPDREWNKPNSVVSKKEPSKYLLTGIATNITSNKKGKATFEVSKITSNVFKCVGRFDEKTLFGRFEVYGEKFKNEDFPNAISIKFNGQIKFGDNDGSGFKPGTKTTFLIVLNIFPHNATGHYTIDEIPNSSYSNTKQNGVLELNVKQK